HCLLHMPQLAELVLVFTQLLPHSISPALGQAQTPALQAWPAGQTLPHMPQLFGSLPVTEMHRPPLHSISPVLHMARHMPPLQFRGVAEQALVQARQGLGSEMTDTPPAPQASRPGRQPHDPFMHDWLAPHFTPQPPQLFRSFLVSTHMFEQLSSPTAHMSP